MITREKIDWFGGDMQTTLVDALIIMSEGNPGGLVVLGELAKREAYLQIMNLDAMNMRGSQIWVAYKDYCGQDIDLLIQKIDERDPAMLDKVNEQCYHPDLPDEAYHHKAEDLLAGVEFNDNQT